MAQEESIPSTTFNSNPGAASSITSTFTLLDLHLSSNNINASSAHFADTPTGSPQNPTTQECIEMPNEIRESEKMTLIGDNVAGSTHEKHNPDDASIDDEAKLHLFNSYTVCLDYEGPILTLKQVQKKTESYISEFKHWKYKFPPKLVLLLLISLGIALYGLINVINSNFNDRIALMVRTMV